jgi:hypothetical protein
MVPRLRQHRASRQGTQSHHHHTHASVYDAIALMAENFDSGRAGRCLEQIRWSASCPSATTRGKSCLQSAIVEGHARLRHHDESRSSPFRAGHTVEECMRADDRSAHPPSYGRRRSRDRRHRIESATSFVRSSPPGRATIQLLEQYIGRTLPGLRITDLACPARQCVRRGSADCVGSRGSSS